MQHRRRRAPHRLQLPTAQGYIARLAYNHARESGLAVERLLAQAGITRSQMDGDGNWIAVRDQIHFLNLVADALPDGLLGARLAQVPDLREMGLLYYVLASSDTLRTALQRVVRYSSIVNEGIAQEYEERGDEVRIRIKYQGVERHSDRHQMEFLMVALLRIARALTGLNLKATRICLVHVRSKEEERQIERMLGRKTEFGANRDEFALERKFGDARIAGADPYLNRLLTSYCEKALAHRRRRESFRTKVENEIAPLLPHGEARIGDVARRLGVSRRTLARRLADEETSFSDVLSAVRFDLAMRYLQEDRFGVSQVAWLLGYRDPASFSRAFRRWTGGGRAVSARAENRVRLGRN